MAFDRTARFRQLREKMAAAVLDSLLIWKPENVYYLTGFTGGESPLLVTGERAWLITDRRYREQAEEELIPTCEPFTRRSSTAAALGRLARRAGLRRVGFEDRHLSWAEFRMLENELEGIELLPAGEMVEDLRVVKDPEEAELIRTASRRTVRVLLRQVPAAGKGPTESELARRLEIGFLRAGGAAAFPPIAAAGSHSSHPHAAPGDRILKPGEIFLVDLGGRWNFYNSDLTRTFVRGAFPLRFKTIYRAVLAAQEAAIRAVRPGVAAAGVDGLARRVLAAEGLGKYFGHGLGHGVGLEVHERPALNRRSRETLREGMVLTVEPGVYIPGWGGVRIEDTVLVTADGAEVLTACPKDLESCRLV